MTPDLSDVGGPTDLGVLGDLGDLGDLSDLGRLAREVKRAQWRQHRAIERRLTAQGSTLAQWDALRAISRAAGSSAHDLAQLTFMSDQAFGTLAARLVAQGLIERRPGEGRRVEHFLTPVGHEVLTAAQATVDEVLEASFARLGGPERAQLRELLSRVGP